jgi:hypothetical protein
MQLRDYDHYQFAANAQKDLKLRLLCRIPRLSQVEDARNNILILSLVRLVANVTVEHGIVALRLITRYIRHEKNEQLLEWLVVCLLATVDIPEGEKLDCIRAVNRYTEVSTFPPAKKLARRLLHFPPEPWRLIAKCADEHTLFHE